jgi:hypothetical protein
MYVIHCHMTGGKTSTREVQLKYPRSTEVMYFDSYDAAQAKAAALQRRRRQKQFATPPYFFYTVQTAH